MRLRAFTIALIAGLLAPAVPAHARVPEKTPRRMLEAQFRRTINTTPARATTRGLIVWRGGKPLYQVNADLDMQPASLLKLATTTAAMELYGPDHRFTTRAASSATLTAGTLNGSLTLIGGGDPTLSTAAYRAERYIGKPKPDDPHPIPAFKSGSATVEDIASRLVSAGVKRINGDLVVDGSLFDMQRTQPGWIPIYLGNDPEVGYIDALTINEGFTSPEAKGILKSPSIAAGQALATALVRAGIKLTGKIRAGRAPSDARTLASVSSPPLSEIIFYTNKWSINYDAEFLLKDMGASFGGGGTSAAGIAVVKRTLSKLEIPVDGLVQYDGSGLSLFDRITPHTIAAILEHILEWPGKAGDAMRLSLPIAGGPGTLFKRMRRTTAAGNLRGKTGTIRSVRAMAGWVTPLDGVPVVYVMIFNHAASAAKLTSPLDFLGVSLTRYPRVR